MSSSQVIANYESLRALTGRMHEAARNSEWDDLVAIERQRDELIAAMKPLDAETPLDKPAQQRKSQLIQDVLAKDVEIRALVEAWMGEFQLSMQSSRQELRLLRKYGR